MCALAHSPSPVRAQVNPDRTFEFTTMGPTTSWFLKNATGLDKGSPEARLQWVAELSVKDIYEIAVAKRSMDEKLQKEELEHVCKVLLLFVSCKLSFSILLECMHFDAVSYFLCGSDASVEPHWIGP